jgi:hypothetical protein
VDSLGICLVGNEWVGEWTLLRTTRCKRGPWVIWTDTSGATSAGTRLYNGYPAIQDDRDSWGMCTISTECKTSITVMLTVMSGMDPDMISETRVGFVELSLVSLVG